MRGAATPSAYAAFCEQRRAALVAARPGLKPTQVMTELAKMWKEHKAALAAAEAAGTGAGAGAGAGEAGGDGAVDLTGADDAAVASLADAMEGAHITTIDD